MKMSLRVSVEEHGIFAHPKSQQRHGHLNQSDTRTPYVDYYVKFEKCPLSFHDQVYLIFLKHGTQSLVFETIRSELLSEFGTGNVSLHDLNHIRFLYRSVHDNTFTLYLKADDICPLGFNCKKSWSSCQRLHTIIIEHVCPDITFSTMWCKNRNCKLIHFIRPHLRDRILSVIFWIYKRHKRQNADLELNRFVISGDEFMASFSEIYPRGPPIPNMTALRWKRVVHRYSKYYIDYEQQREGVDGLHHENKPFITLWRTESVENGWCLRMRRGYKFIIHRICSKWMTRGFECRFCPLSFCPYFHLYQHCVAMDAGMETADCWVRERWIFNLREQEKVIYLKCYRVIHHYHFLIG